MWKTSSSKYKKSCPRNGVCRKIVSACCRASAEGCSGVSSKLKRCCFDKIFASCKENSLDYMSVEETIKLCDEFKIPRVEFHKKVYENIEWARDIANTPSEYTDKHIREGIVLREASGPIKFAKVISENYLLRKGTKTERH